ncbi:MAG: 1-acyl-sn-glycerol-3-phosphate acyltransferase [Candidatus Glassbacteria bacterium]|nr:1-acyl-sn-glycerol-3-phosphate acyltransferase [Candidatus Glassbacteria bacterium]
MPGKKLNNIIYSFSKWLVRVVFRLAFGYRYEGRGNIPSAGPLIIASNHCSYFDPPTVGAAVSRPIYFMAKTELFANPFYGGLIRYFHSVPVRRGGMDWKAMENLKRILKEDGVLIMFPQGTRRAEGAELGKPKFGVGMLAQETQATIIPTFMVGTGRLKDAFLRRRPMRVYYGEPIGPEDYAAFEEGPRGQLQIAELVMDRIAELARSHYPEEFVSGNPQR